MPATEDIIRLQKFQDEEMIKETEKLLMHINRENWNELAMFVLNKIQTFNFRRGNEAAKMLISKYMEKADWNLANKEIYSSLSTIERELAQRYFYCIIYLSNSN